MGSLKFGSIVHEPANKNSSPSPHPSPTLSRTVYLDTHIQIIHLYTWRSHESINLVFHIHINLLQKPKKLISYTIHIHFLRRIQTLLQNIQRSMQRKLSIQYLLRRYLRLLKLKSSLVQWLILRSQYYKHLINQYQFIIHSFNNLFS